MVIFFNIEEVRNHLLTHGSVYTCRAVKRKRAGFMDARHGSYSNFENLGRVYVDFVMVVRNKMQLELFLHNSGFTTMDDWLSHTEGDFPVYLYYVLLMGEEA